MGSREGGRGRRELGGCKSPPPNLICPPPARPVPPRPPAPYLMSQGGSPPACSASGVLPRHAG